MTKRMRWVIFIVLIGINSVLLSQEPYYLSASPKSGDGIYSFLARFKVNTSQCNIDKFYELNQLNSKSQLKLDASYRLPIKIYSYNGKSIRSTINIDNYDNALKIQNYNIDILKEGIRKTDYRTSNILWVPHQYIECAVVIEESEPVPLEVDDILEPLFGKKYEKFKQIDNSLEDRVFYLVSGHGGPDPGAIGQRNGHNLCEDEYAYDVTLRLARNLMKYGAKVHIIVQDSNDGIRDDEILLCDTDETVNGKKIPLNQLKRLEQRTEYINQLYYQNRNLGYKNQVAIMIHVDSRAEDLKKDVFFLYHENSTAGKTVAGNLHETFQNKYKVHRSTGVYNGYTRTRGLYVLRKTAPPAVLVELGNIKNQHDQKRILLSSNRQALADWLFEGLTQERETYVLN